jgi:hypothetical protein
VDIIHKYKFYSYPYRKDHLDADRALDPPGHRLVWTKRKCGMHTDECDWQVRCLCRWKSDWGSKRYATHQYEEHCAKMIDYQPSIFGVRMDGSYETNS